jgi:hypothetical protein
VNCRLDGWASLILLCCTADSTFLITSNNYCLLLDQCLPTKAAQEHDIADMCSTNQIGTTFKTTYIYAVAISVIPSCCSFSRRIVHRFLLGLLPAVAVGFITRATLCWHFFVLLLPRSSGRLLSASSSGCSDRKQWEPQQDVAAVGAVEKMDQPLELRLGGFACRSGSRNRSRGSSSRGSSSGVTEGLTEGVAYQATVCAGSRGHRTWRSNGNYSKTSSRHR